MEGAGVDLARSVVSGEQMLFNVLMFGALVGMMVVLIFVFRELRIITEKMEVFIATAPKLYPSTESCTLKMSEVGRRLEEHSCDIAKLWERYDELLGGGDS